MHYIDDMARKPAPKSKKVAKTRKKSGSWKKTAKSRRGLRKFKKTVVQYVSLFLLFSLSLLTLFSYLSYKKLTSPFVSASSVSSFDIRNEDIFTVSLISVNSREGDFVTTSSVKVLFFDVKNNKVVIYDVPHDLELDIAGRYESESVSKILGMGMALNNDSFESGIDLLDSSLAKLFGFNIDRHIVIEDSFYIDFESILLDDSVGLPFNLGFLSNMDEYMQTDLRFSEMYFIYEYLHSLTSDRFISNTINTSFSEDSTMLDAQLLDLTFDSSLALEKKTFVILNGTQVTGLAATAARAVENMGGRVIVVGNASKTYETSVLIVDDKTSESAKRISRFFSIEKVLLKKDQTTVSESEISRADITLVIGIDNINSL